MMTQPEPTFLSLLGLHHELNDLLARHQAKLVSGAIGKAVSDWAEFMAALIVHADDEEQLLLPLYQKRVTIPRGGTVDLFLAEHRKIRAFLAEISGLLNEVKGMPEPGAHRIIVILEREYEFKKLLEHHDMREKNFLYPLLDGGTAAAERRKMLSRLRVSI